MKILKTAVTTSKDKEKQIQIALEIANELDIPFLERNKQSIQKILEENGYDSLFVVEDTKITVKGKDTEFFFHPSMAMLRIKAIKQGQEDHMLTAMDLKPGDKILDCTLGLATDALVAAFSVGEAGSILGLEASSIIYTITKRGLKLYETDNKLFNNIKNSIEVVNYDYRSFLPTLADNSFDVVYFDPMFRCPNHNSSSLNPLRSFANHEPINSNVIEDALRVAKKRVVVKERSFSKEFAKLGITKFSGGKYSPIIYGYLEKV